MRTMKAMVLSRPGRPLRLSDVPVPRPGRKEILIRVSACGVCRTDLDITEGRIRARLPVIPGHEVIGFVERNGPSAGRLRKGQRVGAGWIHSSCGRCEFCMSGRENLCPGFKATGRDVNGGYAEYVTVPEDSAFAIPEEFSDPEAAPLLCAGSVGYRSLRLSCLLEGQSLGLVGFGACGHLILQMARHKFPKSRVHVFARNPGQRAFARRLGAHWSGGTGSIPPQKLDCIIDTTPAWEPPFRALRNLKPGGRLIINAIQKSAPDKRSLLGMDYQRDLWMEKSLQTVANITREDVCGFLGAARSLRVRPEVQELGLEEANEALRALRLGRVKGAMVLAVGMRAG
jgi:propanol-preferring alcohol dehydrogenase